MAGLSNPQAFRLDVVVEQRAPPRASASAIALRAVGRTVAEQAAAAAGAADLGGGGAGGRRPRDQRRRSPAS